MVETADTHRREPTADRRMAIARAARELIAEKGLEGLRTRDIAASIGINIATLHYHVPTKQALIDLVAESMRAEFIDQHHRRPRAGKPPADLLRMELEDFEETMRTQPGFVRIFAALHERGQRDAAVGGAIDAMQVYWMAGMERILAAGVADGTFRADLDPLAGARLVICALSDYWRRFGADDAWPRFATEIMRSVLRPASTNQDHSDD